MQNPRDRFQVLVGKQPLRNLKILDLGCGILPSFGIVAKNLGAEVVTLAYVDIPPHIRAKLAGLPQHVFGLDLMKKDTETDIEKIAGKDFDIVTQNIISAVPIAENRYIKRPKDEKLEHIAAYLLKSGGWYYGSDRNVTTPLRKK
jgi:hypothetical protein